MTELQVKIDILKENEIIFSSSKSILSINPIQEKLKYDGDIELNQLHDTPEFKLSYALEVIIYYYQDVRNEANDYLTNIINESKDNGKHINKKQKIDENIEDEFN